MIKRLGVEQYSFPSVLLLLVGLFLGFPTLARADHPPELDQVMTLPLQAQDASSGNMASINGPDRSTTLQSAWDILHTLPGGSIYKGHKLKAERDVLDAIKELKKYGRGDSVDEHIRNGIEEVRTCIDNFDGKTLEMARHDRPASLTGPVQAVPRFQDAPALTLTGEQARAIVSIKGDNGEGTGFLVKMPDGPVVVTSLRVLANNPNLKVTDNLGAEIKVHSIKGAADRDIALLSVQDAGFSYLELAKDITDICLDPVPLTEIFPYRLLRIFMDSKVTNCGRTSTQPMTTFYYLGIEYIRSRLPPYAFRRNPM
jgi:hypothetical protein